MAGKKGPGEFSGLDILRALYSELGAPHRPYYKTLVRVHLKGGSYEESLVHTSAAHTKLTPSGHRGAKRVELIREFVEVTCGTLYAPVSALGYRQMDYEWALNFKIDCDIARAKTGDINDAAVHYISDVAAGDHVIRRREILKEYQGRNRPPTRSNSTDLAECYQTMPGLSSDERAEAAAWIQANRQALDDPSGNFKHEEFRDESQRRSVGISAGPSDLDDDAFLDWLVRTEDPRTQSKRKPPID